MTTTKRRKEWIECRVSRGMFSDERTVELGGRLFFVDEKSIRNETEDASAEVEVVVLEKPSGERWAVMPTNSRETVLLGS